MSELVPQRPATGAAAEQVRNLAASAPPAIAAGLLLYTDDLDESHKVSQCLSTELGALWHGIMHRREADFSNAGYWFRQCRGLIARLGIDPVELTDLAERMHLDNPIEIVQMQRDEWKVVMAEALK